MTTQKKSTKGQAATEFLMTYGWAMLVLLVMIGALAYFGILNPSKFTPDKCLFPAGFNCKDYQLKDVNGNLQVLLSLENKQGAAVKIKAVNVTTTIGNTRSSTVSCTTPAAFPTSAYEADKSIQFDCTIIGGSPGAGDLSKVSFKVKYSKVNGVYDHEIEGEITTKVA